MSRKGSPKRHQLILGQVAVYRGRYTPHYPHQQLDIGSAPDVIQQIESEGSVTGDPIDENLVESPNAPEIGGAFAPLMRIQYQRHAESSAILPLSRRVIGGLHDQVEKYTACYCPNSNCLKLYCECFAGGVYCNAYCNCIYCNNDGSTQHQYDRNKAIFACLDRNIHSFQTGISGYPLRIIEKKRIQVAPASRPSRKNETPCCCTKSRCLKKYCDCFRKDDFCSVDCKCQSCMNVPEYPEREQLAALAERKASGRSTVPGVSRGRVGKPFRNVAERRLTSGRNTDFASNTDNRAYPPSFYAVPMPLPSGVLSATLAFGQDEIMTKRGPQASSDDTPGAFDRATATEEAVLGRRKAKDDANTCTKCAETASAKTSSSLERLMQQNWKDETRDVLGSFQAMRQELLQRNQDAGLLGGDIALTREYSYYGLVGSALLASVELELADLLTSVREAKDLARHLIVTEETMNMIESGAAEQGPAKARKISENQRASIIAEAEQDTALMRELARIIRRRTLEMSERL